MATTAELSKRLRTLKKRTVAVEAARSAGNQRALDNAITCRNDARLSIELAFSALRSENARLKAKIESDRQAWLYDQRAR